jgi:hypothetical protein
MPVHQPQLGSIQDAGPRRALVSTGPRRALSLASLAMIFGLSAIVWGGPPASETAPTPDAAPADGPSTDPALTPTTPDPDALPSADSAVLDEAAASVPAVSSVRAKMEAAMASIGELAVQARNDADLVRATCVLDKQERANDVMDLGTSELLIIRDPNTSEQARSFAVEKLEAAALRIDKLVVESKACSGQEGPEDTVDITRNDADEPSDIPVLDPTLGLGDNPVPPPMDGGWPPAASPIE